MRRRIVIALLSLGVVGGYGSGIAHAVHAHRACSHWHAHGDCGGGAPHEAQP